jgi:putative transposase
MHTVRSVPRPPRPQLVDGIYHITSRGNRGTQIVGDDADRRFWLTLLEDTVLTGDWICHTFCLMTNHFHLLVQTPGANVSEGMHRLNSEYAHWFNWRYGLKGHLFQGRFHSTVVEDDPYFVEVARYIALNPVRAGLVARPEEWTWSGFAPTLGLAAAPRFLTADSVLRQFSDDVVEARLAFRDFVEAGMDANTTARPVPDPGMSPLAIAVGAGKALC